MDAYLDRDNNHAALDSYAVFGSDAEEIDSDESRQSTFSSVSTPTVRSVDPSEEAPYERYTAYSLAATDGSARGSPFSGRSFSSPPSSVFDEGSNQVDWLPHLLSPTSNDQMSANGDETVDASSDEDNDEQRRMWHRLGEEQKMKRKLEFPECSSSAKRSCDEPSSSKEGQEEAAEAKKEEEEEQSRIAACSVCLEDIDEGGEHRLVALKCGHPFGESCVKKWLQTVKQSCPLCNRRAKSTDIRVVFLDCFRLGSSYELAEAKREVLDLRTATAQQRSIMREMELQLGSLKAENKTLSDRLRALEKGIQVRTPYSAEAYPKFTFPSESSFTRLSGHCKYMAVGGESLDLVAVSMKPSGGLFDGYGVEMCSLYDLKSSRRAKIIHRQEIKDLGFHPSPVYPWLLTASFDNTARITDVNHFNFSNVQTIQAESKVWSCCWSKSNQTNFFLGLASGAINEYDTRMPSEPVHVLRNQANRCPVVSLRAFEVSNLGSKITGILSPQARCSIRIYKEDSQDETGYTARDFPVSGHCFSLFFDKQSSSVLVSSRQRSSTVLNEIWKLTAQGNEITPTFRKNFRSGGSASVISRPIVCRTPADEAWACCLDDRGKSIQIYSCADGGLRHILETRDPQHEQMTQVAKIRLPGRSQFALLGLSLYGLSIYH
ncbi:E3 ubiquitin-protein ligase RFWD3 [Galendromus occidentalis]|uniref:RING-type E3 ubiquitin transferase n=1 Tax=Galendromus occidentalis TaxID=34638 RepID=A0AAJ6QZ73_9ACAR|nr:E3 ubiquitin-protein ligase RFWD3 [Galendromus occidentalis]